VGFRPGLDTWERQEGELLESRVELSRLLHD
jgi:hypothetical protein